MLRTMLNLLFPVAVLGAVCAAVWFVFAAGWDTTMQWIENQIEEMP